MPTFSGQKVSEGQRVFQGERAEDGESPTVGERATGAGETALTLGTGAIMEPIAGLAGIGQGIYDMVRGRDDVLGSMVERIEGTQNLAYQPRTEEGQQYTQATGEAIQSGVDTLITQPAQRVVEGRSGSPYTIPLRGSPAAGATIQTAGEAIPGAVGLRGAGRAARARSEAREAEQFARQEGIDVTARGEGQAEQIAAAGQRTTGETVAKGESTPAIQESVRRARETERENVDQLFDEARSTRAGLPVQQAQSFSQIARRSVEDFDVDTMPNVQRRLNELDELSGMPANSSVRLEAIDKWRRRLTRNRPAKSDTAQNAAIDILKGQLDNFLENKFTADMISGDPTAIAKWKEARGAFQRFKETFDDNKVLRDIARQEATPEEMRQWIFGASLTGAKKQAGDTVKRLKNIVGEDSPQFHALRDDATLDLVEPLMDDTPNLRGFIRNYDKLVRNNKTVANELFKPEQLEHFRKLRDQASANLKRGEGQLSTPIEQMGIPFALGHGIARGSARMRLGRGIARRLRESRNKRAFLGEVLGYDPYQPMIPAESAQALGLTQAAERQEEQ